MKAEDKILDENSSPSSGLEDDGKLADKESKTKKKEKEGEKREKEEEDKERKKDK